MKSIREGVNEGFVVDVMEQLVERGLLVSAMKMIATAETGRVYSVAPGCEWVLCRLSSEGAVEERVLSFSEAEMLGWDNRDVRVFSYLRMYYIGPERVSPILESVNQMISEGWLEPRSDNEGECRFKEGVVLVLRKQAQPV